ncbi:hypothetical protein EJB05_39752, partial [Eragrostis curvula]
MPSPPDPGAISSRAKLPAAREELRGLAGEKETSRLHGLDLPHLTSSPEMNYCLCHSPIRSGTGGAKKLPDPGMGREERLGLRSSDAPRTSRPQAQRIPSLASTSSCEHAELKRKEEAASQRLVALCSDDRCLRV